MSIVAVRLYCYNDFCDLSDFENIIKISVRVIGYSISDVEMQFGFSCTTIWGVRKYQVSVKSSHLRQQCSQKKNFNKMEQFDDWGESLNVIYVQYFLKLLWISMLEQQQLSACKLVTAQLWIGLSAFTLLSNTWRIARSCQHIH